MQFLRDFFILSNIVKMMSQKTTFLHCVYVMVLGWQVLEIRVFSNGVVVDMFVCAG